MNKFQRRVARTHTELNAYSEAYQNATEGKHKINADFLSHAYRVVYYQDADARIVAGYVLNLCSDDNCRYLSFLTPAERKAVLQKNKLELNNACEIMAIFQDRSVTPAARLRVFLDAVFSGVKTGRINITGSFRPFFRKRLKTVYSKTLFLGKVEGYPKEFEVMVAAPTVILLNLPKAVLLFALQSFLFKRDEKLNYEQVS